VGEQLGLGALGEGEVVSAVSLPYLGGVRVRVELLAGVLAYGFEHQQPCVWAGAVPAQQQLLVDQPL
jgi:hypothetical protein